MIPALALFGGSALAKAVAVAVGVIGAFLGVALFSRREGVLSEQQQAERDRATLQNQALSTEQAMAKAQTDAPISPVQKLNDGSF